MPGTKRKNTPKSWPQSIFANKVPIEGKSGFLNAANAPAESQGKDLGKALASKHGKNKAKSPARTPRLSKKERKDMKIKSQVFGDDLIPETFKPAQSVIRRRKQIKFEPVWPWGVFAVITGIFFLRLVTAFRAVNGKPGEADFGNLLLELFEPTHGGIKWDLDFTYILQAFYWCCGFVAVYLTVTWFFLWKRRAVRLIAIFLCFGFLLTSLMSWFGRLGGFQWQEKVQAESPIYRQEYVDPRGVDLVFPAKPRNIVLLVVESLESTFCGLDADGKTDLNMLPNLTAMAKDPLNINFSDNSKIGGGLVPKQLTWSSAGVVGMLGGIPLKMKPQKANTYNPVHGKYLKGAYFLGDILRKQKYNCEVIMGTDASFAGRKYLYATHGNFDLIDVKSAAENKQVSPNEIKQVTFFKAFTDDVLYRIAKDRLNFLGGQEQPFFYVMETLDTHFPSGYKYPQRAGRFDKDYQNSFFWADEDAASFIAWLKQQPFADNTLIVVVGDHLCMNNDFVKGLYPDTERHFFNLFINSAKPFENNKNRAFSMVDMFPTILAAAGVKIPGDRLAYGVNLFSGKQTLLEKYGLDTINKAFESYSFFYDYTFYR